MIILKSKLRLFSLLIVGALSATSHVHAQDTTASPAKLWVDSVFASLTNEERIAQLMVIRTSTSDGKGGAIFYDTQVDSLVKNYNVGGVCLFQGKARQQITLLNRIQGIAKTPIMVTVDGEWGLGMRFGGIKSFPYQLTMGAMSDADLVYDVGRAIAEQCRRMNIHVNYAPVVDINNNPANPVIGYRSFGENREKVALLGTRIMQGMQDLGIMACAKHFPGHGDVDVDSHYDLPVINKTLAQLDSLELYPFKEVFSKGIASVMIAHLYIPAIDNTANRATSLSFNNVTKLMREQLGYNGLTFTDALEMKGVAKFFPSGEAAVQSVIAGNDMLCLPADVPKTIEAIKKAIDEGRLTWEQVNDKCRRVLEAKYLYVAGKTGPVDPFKIDEDLNKQVALLRKAVAEKALTVVQQSGDRPIVAKPASQTLFVQVGGNAGGTLATLMRGRGAQVMQVALGGAGAKEALSAVEKSGRKQIIVALQGLGRNPSNQFGMGAEAISMMQAIGNKAGATLLVCGNPYALGALQNASFETIAVAYEDDAIFQQAAFDWLTGIYDAKGTLPVTVGKWQAGEGVQAAQAFNAAIPETLGMNSSILSKIDGVAAEAIAKGATPGCVVTVLRKGELVFQKAYGFNSYDSVNPVGIHTIYDLASVTKVSATTLAVMKLYEEGRLDLSKPIGEYLPWLKGTDKEKLTVENLLLHQAGLVSFIPFFREVTEPSGKAKPTLFSPVQNDQFYIPVTEKLFMNSGWRDTMYSRITNSKLAVDEMKYIYSDNDFILMADIVASVSGQPFDRYVTETFFNPLGMPTTRFKAYEAFEKGQVAPTEDEKQFRQGLLWGYVHDPGAAMLGNVAGHAGLFSNATDLARLYQMLLNGGSFQGTQYLLPETIEYFTSYHTPISRRGMGFDKPEKDNHLRTPERSYPATHVSPATYGHTGYTGTCVWVDPAYDLVYIFLSNRVHPDGGENRKLLDLNIRSRIHDIIYESMFERMALNN